MNKRGQREVKADRGVKALDLKIAGGTYRQIAQQLGVSEKTAYYDVQNELAKLDTIRGHKAERLRDLELARLDKMTVALGPAVSRGEKGSIDTMLKLMERRAKLLGLDAAEKTEITGAGGVPVTFTLLLDGDHGQ